jgi:O-succinylbenzoic acid--CoA ligase
MSDDLPPSIPKNCKGEHLFLRSAGGSFTYQDLQCYGEFLIRFLKNNNGINGSRPIGLLASSSNTMVFIIAACWQLGIPFTVFNPNAKPLQLRKQINAINPQIIIGDSKTTAQFDDYTFINISQLNYAKAFERNRDKGEGSGIQVMRHCISKIFGYFFTSGTSGQPKIVPLKRRQMHAAAESSAKNIKPDPNQCWYLCLPLHHIGGASVILRSLIYGSAIYRTPSSKKEETATHLSQTEDIVAASLVPTMLNRLFENPDFKTHKSFEAILLGGGPISDNLIETSLKRRIPIIPSYGMTETCAQIAANALTKNSRHKDSVGSVFEPNHIQIRDDENSRLPKGESGTVWVKGPQVFDGYYNRSSKYKFDKNGWFNTGDFGRLDEKDNLYIEARRKDLIVTGGENVLPIEVEEILQEMDSIKEAAVFGIKDQEWGQKIVAAVVFSGGVKESTESIRKKLKELLEDYKIPKEFIALDSLPRTETNKIKRTKLKQFHKTQR